jgi:hypothetical protein
LSNIDDSSPESNPGDNRIDFREQPFNTRSTGPITRVQFSQETITALHGVVFDIDLNLFRDDAPNVTPGAGPEQFHERTLRPWLDRHPVLARAEVRDSGRGLHVLLWFDQPVVFENESERQRWAGIVKVVQAALPIDPDQPGITALTRPIGSTNGKTGRPVTCLQPGSPVPVGDVLELYERMVWQPFRTVMGILLGGDRINPCPVCRAEGTSLSALDYVGQCYGSCGKVKIEDLYDLFLVARPAPGKEATLGDR